MATLMNHVHSQDWSRWAAGQPARTCKHCRRDFQPNHPRRQACGLPDCADLATVYQADIPGGGRARARARETGLQGLLAEVLIDLNRGQTPEGTRAEILDAIENLVASEASGAPVRAVYVRLMAAVAARTLQMTGGVAG